MVKKTASKRSRNLDASRKNDDSIESSRTSTRPRTRARSNTQNFSSTNEGSSYLKELIANPALRYVASGIATAVLTRFVTRISTKYPEISNFLRENMESIEEKLSEFKQNVEAGSSEENQVPRH